MQNDIVENRNQIIEEVHMRHGAAKKKNAAKTFATMSLISHVSRMYEDTTVRTADTEDADDGGCLPLLLLEDFLREHLF